MKSVFHDKMNSFNFQLIIFFDITFLPLDCIFCEVIQEAGHYLRGFLFKDRIHFADYNTVLGMPIILKITEGEGQSFDLL